ncbi:MAG TPA: hypothetical protein VJB68_08230, partial [Methylophilaceae bacterium]|nr:hypothetical protein [Methylophilaceae bacterium]
MNSLVGKRAVRAAMPLVAKSGASLTPSEQAAVRRNALQRDIAKNSKQQKGLAQRLSGASGFAKNSQQAYQAATVARQEQEKQVATSKKFQEDRLKEISQLRRESEAALVSGDSKIYRSKLDNARYTQAAYDNGEKILQGHTSKLNELRQAEQQKKGEYSNSLANVQEVKRLHDGNVRKVKLQETLDGFQGDLAAIDAGELDGGALTPDDVVKLKEGIRKMITRTEQQLAGIPIGGKIRQPAERPAPSVKPQTSTPKPPQPRDDELIPTVKSPHAPAGSSAVDTQQAEQQAIQRVFNAIEAASRAGQPLPSRAELMRNPQMALAQAQELIKAMAKKTEEDPQSLDENLRGIEAVLASMHDVLGKTEQKLDLSQLSAEINKVQEARSAGKEINL